MLRRGTSVGILLMPLAAVLCAVTVRGGQDRRLVRAEAEGRRLAVVVGNDAYADAPLRNARNDARAMTRALEAAGFRVTLLQDATREQLALTLANFGDALRADDVAVLYFAGHGVQVDAENYVIPIDFHGRSISDIRLNALKVSEIEHMLQTARVSMLILDACRNNSFAGTRGGAGLAAMEARGSLIAFATGAGQTAADGDGTNGLFTSELVKTLNEPGLPVQEVFRRVRRAVFAASGGRQFPAVYDGLLGDFVFTPATAAPAAPVLPPSAPSPASRGDGVAEPRNDDALAVPLVAAVPPGTYGSGPGPAISGASHDWAAYGGDAAQSRYSPLAQINSANVGGLQMVMRANAMPPGIQTAFPSAKSGGYAHTPLVIGGYLYASTPIGTIAAFDPMTYRQIWYDVPPPGTLDSRTGPARGLAYWTNGRDARVFAVQSKYLVAYNAQTGRRYPDFGVDGRVTVTKRDSDTARVVLDRAVPAVVGDVVVIGGVVGVPDARVGNTIKTDGIKGYDVRTGSQVWSFDPVSGPGMFGADSWENDALKYANGTVGWSPITADASLGLLYVVTGSPVTDARTRPGNNLFANSIVALNAKTGQRVWHFQLVHHATGSTEIPNAPVLADVEISGRARKIVAHVSAGGLVYVFDRTTGQPIWPIVETPVTRTQQDEAPTQPIPSKPVLGSRDDGAEPIAATAAAFDPSRGVLYVSATREAPTGRSELSAIDLHTGDWKWSQWLPSRAAFGALLVTKDLVFVCERNGKTLHAFDSTSPRHVSQLELPGAASGPAITYMTGGRQYILIPTTDSPTGLIALRAR
jgi:outer membrane protein assembly factor BamB